MSERITCPITLGEYERIMNDKKEHKCNCNGKCKVCKCKSEEELNIYDRLTDTQKEIVYKVCEDYNLNLEECELKTHLGTGELAYDSDEVLLCTPKGIAILPIQVKDIGIENKIIDNINIYDRLNEEQKEIVRSVCEERDLKIEDCKMERQVSPSGNQTPNLLIKTDTVTVLISNLFNDVCKVGDEECQNH